MRKSACTWLLQWPLLLLTRLEEGDPAPAQVSNAGQCSGCATNRYGTICNLLHQLCIACERVQGCPT
jgi:hypothetical protein